MVSQERKRVNWLRLMEMMMAWFENSLLLARLRRMLFMVIEKFRNGDARAVGNRFQQQGRMLPENVRYVASWMDGIQMRCFQLMEAPNAEALKPWVAKWEDLVEFEIVAVGTSQEFWARAQTA